MQDSPATRLARLHGKIIDFRLRPPTGPYRNFFTPTVVGSVNRILGHACRAPTRSAPIPSRNAEERAIRAMIDEMDAVGVRLGVMNGRHSVNRPVPVHIEDADLAELTQRTDNRVLGLAGIDFDKPTDEIIAGLDTAVKELRPGRRLHGAGPGARADVRRRRADLPALREDRRTRRAAAVHDRAAGRTRHQPHRPGALRPRGQAPPRPCRSSWATAASPTSTRRSRWRSRARRRGCTTCSSPRTSTCSPRAVRGFVEGINWLPNRFVYASAYSFCGVEESVHETLKLRIDDEALDAYMYRNAEALLRATGALR